MRAPLSATDRLRMESAVTRLDEEIVEMSLLLPGWQAEELTQMAQWHGLSAAQMVRRLIRDFCLESRLASEAEPWA